MDDSKKRQVSLGSIWRSTLPRSLCKDLFLKSNLVGPLVFSLLISFVARSEEGRGRAYLETLSFLAQPSKPVSAVQGVFEGEYDQTWAISSAIDFKSHPLFRGNLNSQTSEQDWVFDPREISIGFNGDAFFLRLGGFTPLWEGTDGVNPMDLSTMKDWSDPVRSKTLASLGVVMGGAWGPIEAEGFWIPRQTKSLLPGVKSPWLPRRGALPLRDQNVELRLSERVEYEYLDRREIDHALDNNFGLRIQLHGDFGDLSVAGFEGAGSSPLITVPVADLSPIQVNPQEIYELQSPVRLQAVDYLRRSGAVLISVPWETWIFRLSARHDQPLGGDEQLPGWSQQSVFGIEKNFSTGSNTVTGVLQGAWGQRADGDSLLTVSDLFDQALLAGLRWPMGENWLIFLSGFMSLKDHSTSSGLEINYRLGDHGSIDIFYQNLEGPKNSLIGILSDRDHAGVRFNANF